MEIVLDRDDDQIRLGCGHDPQAGAACRGGQRLRGLVGGTVTGHRHHADRGALKLGLGLHGHQAKLDPQRLAFARRRAVELGDVALGEHVGEDGAQARAVEAAFEGLDHGLPGPAAIEERKQGDIELAGQPEAALLGEQQHLTLVQGIGGELRRDTDRLLEVHVRHCQGDSLPQDWTTARALNTRLVSFFCWQRP